MDEIVQIRVIALDRALGLIGKPNPGASEKDYAKRAVEVAERFEAYLIVGRDH